MEDGQTTRKDPAPPNGGSDARLREVLENVGDAYVSVDRNWRIVWMNQRAATLAGLAADEAIGQTFWTGMKVTAPPEFEAALRDTMATGTVHHLECHNLQSERWYGISVHPSAEGLTILARDITGCRHAETAQTTRDSLFRTLAEALPGIVWSASADGSLDFVNSRLVHDGERPLWSALLHPDDQATFFAAWHTARQTSQPFQVEHRLRDTTGNYRWHLSRAQPIRDDGDAVTRWLGTSTDIHECKQIGCHLLEQRTELERQIQARTDEVEAFHRQARLTDRMASLGVLAAGLGHDLGNMLMPMRMHLDAMETRGLPAEATTDMAAIRAAADAMRRLVSGLRLLALDPDDPGSPGDAIDLHGWWAEIEPLMRTALPRGVALFHRFAAALPRVALARHRLTQAVFNLVQNAGEVMAQSGGTITVWAEPGRGDQVRLGVSDTGPGMSDEVRRRCLEPFFTTKNRGLSTGLGLPLVESIARKAGGTLAIDSQPGQGATFVLVLPTTAAAGRPAGSAAVVTLRDTRMRTYVGSLLRPMGFEVRFEPGPAALLVTADDAEARRFVRERRGTAVLFDRHTADEGRILALGPDPKPAAIRHALREAARRSLG